MKTKEGEIYKASIYNGYIFRATNDLDNCNNICIGYSSYHKASGYLRDEVSDITEATEREKSWPIACEKAGKFIPLGEIEHQDLELCEIY